MVLLAALVLNVTLCSAGCEVESISVDWTAFQTADKKGVKGSFDTVNSDAMQKKDDCAFSYFTMATVHIETKSVKTDNAERDQALVSAFFKNMVEGDYIDALIKRVDLDKEELSVEITMNDVSQSIYMHYNYDGKVLKAKGKVDLLNFSAQTALNAINEISSTKGKGKTWSDVDVEFTLVLKEKCE